MHILYIYQYFISPSDAGGTRSWSLSHLIKQRGHKVTILSSSNDYKTGKRLKGYNRILQQENLNNINVLRIGFEFPYFHTFLGRVFSYLVFTAFSCFAALRMPAPDVTFASSTPITVAIPALLLYWLKRVPIVFEVRDLWPDFLIQYGILNSRVLIRIMYMVEKFIYQQSEAIVTTSPWMYNKIIAKGVPKHKVFCVPIGAELELYHPSLATQRDIRKELGITANELLVIYTGAHGIPNALDTLVEAAALLKNKPIHFLFVGDGRCKASLQKRAQVLSLEHQVHFWPPHPRTELGPILANADLCIISLRGVEAAYASFPNKLFDYLASGKPILVNSPGDIANLLFETKTGFIVQCESPQEIARTLEELVDQKDNLERMGKKARQVAEQQFDRNILYKSIVNLLESIAKPKDE
jgi:glycosyltransferase involved in cell wall biosynthesis